MLSHETMEVDSIIRFKKAIEKFIDNGDIRDVPASMTNLTNMGGKRRKHKKCVWAFMLFLNSITFSYCPIQNIRLDPS